MEETRLEERLTDFQVSLLYFTILFGGTLVLVLLFA